MKQFCAVLLLLLPAGSLFGQGYNKAFEDFSREIASNARAFGQKSSEDFSKALALQWEEFQLFQGTPNPMKPKPDKAPAVQETDIFAEPAPVVESRYPEIAENVDDTVFSMMFGEYNQHGYDTGFSWFGIELPWTMPQYVALVNYQVASSSEKDVTLMWKDLEQPDGEPEVQSFSKEVIPVFQRIANTCNLSDWTLYLLVKKASERWWDDHNSIIVAQAFILSHLGFNARIARADGSLVLMLPFRQTVYNTSYISIDGQTFYLMGEQVKGSVYTYRNTYPGATRQIDLTLSGDDTIFQAQKPDIVSKELPTLGITLNLPVRRSKIDFYQEYPQCPAYLYSRGKADCDFSSTLIDQLSFLKEMDMMEAVSLLLKSIQHDFQYQTDQKQFNREKPFFLEENFFYEANDCEDRAFLFSFLVKNLFGLDTVLLEFPGHIATAVAFKQPVQGTWTEVKGVRYTVCDPTFIGAEIGMVMPQYKNSSPSVYR